MVGNDRMQDANADDSADEQQFGSRVHASRLLQIRADDVHEFVRGLSARPCRLFGQDVRADVFLEHLRHESIHGTPGGSDELQRRCAAVLRFKGTLDGIHLSADTTDASEQLILVADGMAHAHDVRS